MATLKEIKKNYKFLETRKIDIGEDNPVEVDVFYLKSNRPDRFKEEYKDPFLTNDFSSMPTPMKRRGNRLLKRDDEAKSKLREIERITGYDVLQVVPPPYNLEQLAKLYDQNSTHNSAVTMKAVNIVGLGYRWVENPRTQLELEDAEEKGEELLNKFMKELKKEKISLDERLSEICHGEEFNSLMIKVWTDVESLGNGYLEVSRNRNGEIGYIGHAPGHTIRIRAARDGYIQLVADKYTFFRNFGDTISENPTPNPLKNDDRPNELIHFSKYSPSSTYYGVPDIIPALSAVLGDKLAKQYNLDYFDNKSIPRYAFILKGAKLSQQAETNLINYFRNELKGQHHGTLYIPLPASIGQQVDADFIPLEIGVQQASFVEYLKENRQEILMVHRTPPGKVGVYQNMNLAVSRDADKTFSEQVCEPEQRNIENKLNKMFAEFTDRFLIRFLESDIIDADIKSRIHDRYLRTQVLVPNEVREDIGKPPKKGGNIPLPYQRGPNEGGPGQRTSEGAKPRTVSPADDTGQRKVRGEAQDRGEEPAK